jgi:hypothetical protein
MRKLLVPFAGVVTLISGAILLTPTAEATVWAAASSIRATFGATKLVENAACLPRRVCGFRGCRYRKVCKRSQGL